MNSMPLSHLTCLKPSWLSQPQPQRRAVPERQRQVVHVVGQHREVVAHLLHRVGVVVDAAVRSVAEAVEDDPPRRWERVDQVHHAGQGDTSPLGDAGPALDAEVLRHLLLHRQGPQLRHAQLDRMLDKSVDAQPVVGKPAGLQREVLGGVRVDAVVPEVRTDVGLGVLTGLSVEVLEQPLRGTDERRTDPLDRPRVPQRERRRSNPPDDQNHHRQANSPNPSQLRLSVPL